MGKTTQIYRYLSNLLCLHILFFSLHQSNAQTQIGTWANFSTAAATYTFDDNTANQLPKAIPIFNKYNFKATLFTVTNWGPNWQGLREAQLLGHEVASHTITHPSLSGMSIASQENELMQSQATIKSNVNNAPCLTIAYPFCNLGDIPTIGKYYIAGRICSGIIESKSPANFFQISSIIAGTEGSLKTAADFDSRISNAKQSGGWAVFLIHGIDNDGGYSPLPSSVLETHLENIYKNLPDVWVATFLDVVKYIKERDASKINAYTSSENKISFSVNDGLDDNIYNLPISVRNEVPSLWKHIKIFQGDKELTFNTLIKDGVSYVQFDALANGKEIVIQNETTSASSVLPVAEIISINPNPSFHYFSIKSLVETYCWITDYTGKHIMQFPISKGQSYEFGNELAPGSYILSYRSGQKVISKRIIKI